jgi:hypothetical protein
VTRKAWNDDAGDLVKVASDGTDPFVPVGASERRVDPLTITCIVCNAKPGEKCSSLIEASRTLEIPHFTRRSA